MKILRTLLTVSLMTAFVVMPLASCSKNSTKAEEPSPETLAAATAFEEAKAAFEAKDYEKVASFLPAENREMILMALKSNFMKVELGNILSKEKREQDVLIVCEAKIGDDSGTYDVPMKKVNDAWTISIGGIKKHGDSTPK